MNIYNHSEYFVVNKYYKWYYSIIEKAISEKRKKKSVRSKDYIYYESHHVLPSSIFPIYKNAKENPWNIVLLTAKEHFVCHLLLPKIATKENHIFKLVHALYAMTQQNNSQQQRNNSKMYEYAKRNMINIRSDKTASKEWRLKLSEASKKSNHMIDKTGDKNPFFGRTHTEEVKQSIGSKNKGLKRTEGVKEKLRGSRGTQKNPAPILECPHCLLQVKKGNIWHFDRCRKKLS